MKLMYCWKSRWVESLDRINTSRWTTTLRIRNRVALISPSPFLRNRENPSWDWEKIPAEETKGPGCSSQLRHRAPSATRRNFRWLAGERREMRETRGRTNSSRDRYTRIRRMIDTRPGKTRVPASGGPPHTGRRAASRRMLRGIWPRVRAGHCDSCIVRISSVHFRTSALWPGTWLVCAHLTWPTHCARGARGDGANTIIPILPRTRRPPIIRRCRNTRGGDAVPFSGFITIFLDGPPYKRTRVFHYAKLSETIIWDLRECPGGEDRCACILHGGHSDVHKIWNVQDFVRI